MNTRETPDEGSGAMHCSTDFGEFLTRAAKKAENYQSCMALSVSEEGKHVELILDTSIATYGDWIKGEGGDICLLRCQKTDRVVGCHLPLMDRKLCIHHDGPIRINAGFLKEDCP